MDAWVLVTGAGKRFGRLVALGAARAGWDVVVHHNSSEAEARETADMVASLGRRAITAQATLADERGAHELVGRVAREIGSVPTALVNSASLFEWDDLGGLGAERLNRLMGTNVVAPLALVAAIERGLAPGATASVVNVLDFKLVNPNPDYLSYTLSKYALQGATRLLARQLAPRVRVNAVSPGYMLPAPGQDEGEFAALSARTPLARTARAEDVAATVVHVLGNGSMTGQEIAVDCGAHFETRDRDIAFPTERGESSS